MNYTAVRKLLLKVFIGFLSMTAIVAILSVLSGEFDETQIKVLVTTFSITAGSICAMACAGFIEKRGEKTVGFVGILAACGAVALVIIGMWGEIDELAYWKATITFIVVCIAFAHVCLLHLPTMAASHRWTQLTATILITLLAVQIIAAVLGEIGDEKYYRLMAALSVLVVLATLVVPICSRLGAHTDGNRPGKVPDSALFNHVPERLVLQRRSGVIYTDQLGCRYQVIQILAEPGTAPNGGPAAQRGSSGGTDGPPSVS